MWAKADRQHADDEAGRRAVDARRIGPGQAADKIGAVRGDLAGTVAVAVLVAVGELPARVDRHADDKLVGVRALGSNRTASTPRRVMRVADETSRRRWRGE